MSVQYYWSVFSQEYICIYIYVIMWYYNVIKYIRGMEQNVAKATLLNIINITTYFKNLINRLRVLYALNIHVKFCANRILFTI